jgi:Kef-type K+ transport system membrane component KefB
MPSGGGVQSVEALFLLLLVFVASFAALARKLKIPYPIVLVIAGLLLGFLPGVPRISLDPDIVFLVFLPRYFMPQRGLSPGVNSSEISRGLRSLRSDWSSSQSLV